MGWKKRYRDNWEEVWMRGRKWDKSECCPQLSEIFEKTWEISQKTWEFSRKTLEISWKTLEIFRKTLEIFWKTWEIFWGPYNVLIFWGYECLGNFRKVWRRGTNKGGFEWDVREVGEGNKARLGGTRLRKKEVCAEKGREQRTFCSARTFCAKE